MTPKQVRSAIEDLCRELYNAKLVWSYNPPVITGNSGKSMITWPAAKATVMRANAFGSLNQYLDWIRDGAFTCLLFDYSIIQVSYEMVGSEIHGHNLLYWPCPFGITEGIEDLSDIVTLIELYLESPGRAAASFPFTARSPMRFDFDPLRAGDGHPVVHLHTQFEDARIHIRGPLTFSHFIRATIRTFYQDKWKENSWLEDIHEQATFRDCDVIDPTRHCWTMSWA
ncbi:MAG: DUF2290 domain-containing protein [Gemmataceae bacterium]